jgi:hypothetical protein
MRSTIMIRVPCMTRDLNSDPEMMMRRSKALPNKALSSKALLAAAVVLASATMFNARSEAQSVPQSTATATPDNAMLLTVFLKHDQSRPLAELNAQLEKQGFYKQFPPAGVEVVNWNVVMGIGQVVTLRFPASRLREINRVLEDTAWGPYRTEFYPTYDYKAVGIAAHEKAVQ